MYRYDSVVSQNIRYKSELIDDERFTEIFGQVDKLPKPVLICTNHALHTLVILLKYLVAQQRKISEQIDEHIEKTKLLLKVIGSENLHKI